MKTFIKSLTYSAVFSLITTLSFAEPTRQLKLISDDRNYEVEISLPVILLDRTAEDVGANSQEGYALVTIKREDGSTEKSVFLFSPDPRDALYTGWYNWKEAEGTSELYMRVANNGGKFWAELKFRGDGERNGAPVTLNEVQK
jgi:hypothetical protein